MRYERFILVTMVLCLFALLLHNAKPVEIAPDPLPDPAPTIDKPDVMAVPATIQEPKIVEVKAVNVEIEEEPDKELVIFANAVEAEAGNQGETGKRLVADVILNRVDDPDFPDTIEGVISQKYQFESFWDGGMEKWQPTEETIEICREELEDRTDYKVLFFTAGEYNPYGTPAFIHGDHYFSYK